MRSFATRRARPRPGGRVGGSLLELVLTLAILFNLCYGTIEFGYYFFVKNSMQGAAREGARAAIVAGATDSNVTSAVISALSGTGLCPANQSTSGSDPYTCGTFTVTITPTLASATVGNPVTVQVTAAWGTVGAGFRPLAIIGSAKVVTASAVMRKEG